MRKPLQSAMSVISKVSSVFGQSQLELPQPQIEDEQSQVIQKNCCPQEQATKKVRFDLNFNAQVAIPGVLEEENNYTKFYKALPTVYCIAKDIN